MSAYLRHNTLLFRFLLLKQLDENTFWMNRRYHPKMFESYFEYSSIRFVRYFPQTAAFISNNGGTVTVLP